MKEKQLNNDFVKCLIHFLSITFANYNKVPYYFYT